MPQCATSVSPTPKKQQNISYAMEGMLPNHKEPALTVTHSMHAHSFALTELLTWGNSREHAPPCSLSWMGRKETQTSSDEERHEDDMSVVMDNTSYCS